MKTLNKLHTRLQKIGINITCIANYPWIYLDTINNQRVTEKFGGRHGFTIAMLIHDDVTLTDRKEIFHIIRKYSTVSSGSIPT